MRFMPLHRQIISQSGTVDFHEVGTILCCAAGVVARIALPITRPFKSSSARPVGSRVSVGEKPAISGMRPQYGMGMTNRTEALFHSRGDFRDPGEQAVGIRTINAAHLLNRVQIGETFTVADQKILSPDFGNSIDRETN